MTSLAPREMLQIGHLNGKSLKCLSQFAKLSLQHFGCLPSCALKVEDFVDFAKASTKLKSLAVRAVPCFKLSLFRSVVSANSSLTHIAIIDCGAFRASAGE